jgi:hypothetical protein
MSDALYRYECVIAPHLLVPPALQDLITLRSANVYVRNSQDPDLLKKMSIDRGTAEYEMLDWDDSIPPHRRQDYAARQQRWQPITTENVLVSEYKIKWVYPYRHLISKGNIAIWKMYHLVRSPDPSNLPSPPKEWLM